MTITIHADRLIADEACRLARDHGAAAAAEAKRMADRSREVGNLVRFCRLRQASRLLAVLQSDRALGTVH